MSTIWQKATLCYTYNPGDAAARRVTSMVDGGWAGADNIDALVSMAQAAPNRVRI